MKKQFKDLDEYEKMMYFTKLDQILSECGISIIIDKLRLCYNVIDSTIIDELEKEKPDIYRLFDFDLVRIEGRYHNDIYQIRYNDVDRDNNIKSHIFGELRINRSADNTNIENEDNFIESKYKQVWIYVNNSILYSHYNKLIHLNYISSHLGLLLNNITAIEIAIDTNKNVPQRLKGFIRNEGIETILNDKLITNREEDRPEFDFNHSGDMNKYKYLTVYIKQIKALKNKSKGIVVCAYNKLNECENSGKKYILDYYDNPTKLYRLEVRSANEKFKEYLNKYRIVLSEQLLCSNGFLFHAFEHFFNSVIRFRSNNKIISLGQILY
jgi:hypothetical protein